MPVSFPGIPYVASNTGVPDLMKAINSGFETYYKPKASRAQIADLQAKSRKNETMAKLFDSLIGQDNGGGGGLNSNQFGAPGGNLKAAVLKAFTGIDPFLMSPQQTQQLHTEGAVHQAAQKKNIDTGASDVVRERLQNVVSMPKEYMGAFGSLSQTKDRLASQLGDKAASERLIQAALAERLLPEYAGAQLQSQGIRSTVPALEHQRQAIRQGWPNASNFISGNLPPELQKEVERRHNEAVKSVNRNREKFLSSGGKRDEESTSDREVGININEVAHRLGVNPSHIIEDAEFFKTDPENIISALQAGVKSEDEMRDWLKGIK